MNSDLFNDELVKKKLPTLKNKEAKNYPNSYYLLFSNLSLSVRMCMKEYCFIQLVRNYHFIELPFLSVSKLDHCSKGHGAVLRLVAQSCPTLCDSIDCSPPGSSVHADSPGKNTGVVCHALLSGIFPTQGLNPGHLHCKWILYHLRHQGSPRSWQRWYCQEDLGKWLQQTNFVLKIFLLHFFMSCLHPGNP